MRRDDPGPYSLETLAAMGPPQLFTTDAQVLKARYVAWFEEQSGRTLYPMQVEMLLIEALAYAMSIVGEEAQAAVEAGLVAFAVAGQQDALGPNRSTARLPAAKARVTLRFSIAAPASVNTIVPAGVVSAGGGIRFQMLSPAIIRAGLTSADVEAEAVEAGEAANGFGVGQLTILEIPIAGVSVTNISISAGGSEIETDQAYQLRLANAFDRVSSGGGYGWYRETAMGASAALVDCGVIRPQPCYIDVYPLTASGPASLETRNLVLAAFETARSLENRFGDLVTVKPPVAVTAAPVLTLWARGVPPSLSSDARDAAMELLSEWGQRLGATVAPHDVEARVRALPGVINVAITGLSFDPLGEDEFLVVTSLTVNIEWVA